MQVSINATASTNTYNMLCCIKDLFGLTMAFVRTPENTHLTGHGKHPYEGMHAKSAKINLTLYCTNFDLTKMKCLNYT